ncbi:MAG: lipopolysaccharide kinase InaA family protein [Gemmatimonadota bacterium]
MPYHGSSPAPTTLHPSESAFLKHEKGTWVWREPSPGDDVPPRVVKLYRHRGLTTTLRSRVTRFRVEREAHRLEHLCRHEIPCTVPLGWGWGHSSHHGHHEFLVMEELPRVVQLKSYLATTLPPPDELAPLFRLARRMHESGVCSQTFYDYNVLVDREAPPETRYFLSDFPRSFVFPWSIVGSRMAVLDLLDLAADMAEQGVDAEPLVMSAYGLDGPGLAFWTGFRSAGRDPREKRFRSRRDLRVRMKWSWAWVTSRFTSQVE